MSGTFLVSRGVGVFGTDASTPAVNPFSEAYAIANNMRIASLSIAAYEYVTSYVSSMSHPDLLSAQLSHHSPC
jgi:hypothetical protein